MIAADTSTWIAFLQGDAGRDVEALDRSLENSAAGTYPGDVRFSGQASLNTTFRVPDDAQPGQTIHLILEATDNGTPPLTRYQRVIVRVQ
jgi:hypothetical protein